MESGLRLVDTGNLNSCSHVWHLYFLLEIFGDVTAHKKKKKKKKKKKEKQNLFIFTFTFTITITFTFTFTFTFLFVFVFVFIFTIIRLLHFFVRLLSSRANKVQLSFLFRFKNT